MSAQISLYKDAARTQMLSVDLFTTTIDLGLATIPSTGTSPQSAYPCYCKNTGDRVMQDVYATAAVSSAGRNSAALVADTDITPDLTGSPNSNGWGTDGGQVLVYSGMLNPATPAPSSNTSGNVSNPTMAPTLSVGPGSTNLSAGQYLVAYTYANSTGETLVSPTASLTINAGQSVRVSAVPLTSGATFIRFYITFLAGSTALFFAAQNNGGVQIDLSSAQGFFQFWVRQNLKSADIPGTRQAKLQLDSMDIGPP